MSNHWNLALTLFLTNNNNNDRSDPEVPTEINKHESCTTTDNMMSPREVYMREGISKIVLIKFDSERARSSFGISKHKHHSPLIIIVSDTQKSIFKSSR